ncbi:glycoside hydrolase family 2 TIM barrel-domain containing protein [Flavitalea sp.]|nr:glycoside hydrolase family 2 TIM barrel-domain containing protein [Flavitalea sp.]
MPAALSAFNRKHNRYPGKLTIKSFFIAQLMMVFISGMQPLYAQAVIIKKGNAFELNVNGTKTFIKGAVAYEYIDKIKKYGGNAIRIPCKAEQIAKAGEEGLMAMVGLPFESERNGFDYNDKTAVQRQLENVLALVKQFKNNPAIQFWAVGNELDFIPPDNACNPAVWDAVNSAAKAIKAIDPNRLVLTVIGTGRMYKLADIIKRCPDLDLLGLNTYKDIYGLADTLGKWGWNKPYVIAEWGPSGYWEVRKTPWKAPFEQTAAEKAVVYKDKYEKVILANEGQCLGSFVFYWSGHKQETTHTWFNMFDSKGNETPVVDVMQYLWAGKWPSNRAPVTDSISIDGKSKYQIHRLSPSSSYTVQAFASDPDKDILQFTWEIRPEAQYASYAGQGEKEPQPIAGLTDKKGNKIQFTTPPTKGAYRLFVYVTDKYNHSSSANTPFYVE